MKNRAYWVYLVYSGLISFLFFLVFNINSYYRVTIVGLDPLQLVLVGTCLEVSIFLFEIPTGVIADVYSRRLSVVIGVGLMGISFLFEGIFPVFWIILLMQILWGMGYTFTSGALQAWMTDEIGEDQAGQILLKGAQWETVGALTGIVVSTILANYWVRLPFMISGCLMILLTGVLLICMPENGFKPTASQDRNNWQKMWDTLRLGMDMVRQRPALRPILWIGFFLGLYSEGFDRLWVAHINSQFVYPFFSAVTWMGIFQGGSMLFSALVMGLVHKKVEMGKPRNLLVWLSLLSAILILSLLFFGLTQNFLAAVVLYILIMVIRQVQSPMYTSWVNYKLDSQVRATILSISSQVDAVGQVAGGPLTGLVARQTSTRLGLLFSAGLLAPVMIVFGGMFKQKEE